MLGPLRLSGEEKNLIDQAAAQEGLAPGAWAAGSLVRLARQDVVFIPVTDRDRILEFARSRADLVNLAEQLRHLVNGDPAPTAPAAVEDLVRQIGIAVQRIQVAADAVTAVEHTRRAWKRR